MIQIKYKNLGILVGIGLFFGFALWWFLPQRIINECDALKTEALSLKKKVYQLEHPKEHRVHFGVLGVRTASEVSIFEDEALNRMFQGDTQDACCGKHYRYPLNFTCGCSNDSSSYVLMSKLDTTNYSFKKGKVRRIKENYYEVLQMSDEANSMGEVQ